MTPRTEQRETVATAILDACMRLAQRGSAFTVQDVVKEADVAVQTFYRYFGGKDQLVLAVIAEWIRRHRAQLEDMTSGVDDPVRRLEMYVRSTLTPLDSPERIARAQFITAEHARLHLRFPHEIWAAIQPMTDLVERELVAGKAAGRLHPRKPDHDAWLLVTTLIGAFHRFAFMPDDPFLTTIADDVWSFCLDAVGGR